MPTATIQDENLPENDQGETLFTSILAMLERKRKRKRAEAKAAREAAE